MNIDTLKAKVKTGVENVIYYWNKPPKNRYMTYKEIAAYSFGGIGFYMIVQMSYVCLLSSTNVFITGTIGISPTDMYVMYVLAVISGVPLTALRAHIIDNTRNKAGKYRPYLLRMGIPTAILFVAMVWFPYDELENIVGTGEIFGESADYIAKCAVLLIFNILLQFFYYFFYDSYENLIHVLSPNSQERADVSAIKSVVYSLGPSIMNIIMPLVAQNVYNTNSTDVRVYRLVYPIVGVIGILLSVIVYANTQEKIIQAKTHIVQIKFMDALKAVSHNKYFWIIALAGWIGFLESAYSNILYWLYNYGGAASGDGYAIIVTIYGNASLWGMVLAPLCIRKWGKRNVKVVTNLLNIVFILMMLPFVSGDIDSTGNLKAYVIWCVLICLYFNAACGAFAKILDPSMQADIRDYQQYITGERIDGMFSAITAVGNVITLATAAVLPALQEYLGMNEENAAVVTSDSSLMSRILPGSTQTVGEMLIEQAENGQEIVTASNALYDVEGTLIPLLQVLIIVSAVGATLNVIPLFFYDFKEQKQKSIVRVLKIRALFEDYGNNALTDRDLVEAIDIVNNAREMAVKEPETVSKKAQKPYLKAFKKNLKAQGLSKEEIKEQYKAAKKEYRAKLEYNEEIEISKFVCAELDKFDTESMQYKVSLYAKSYEAGLDGIKSLNKKELKAKLKYAKSLPDKTPEEKEHRQMMVEYARKNLSSLKYYNKHFANGEREFVRPDTAVLERLFDEEDEYDDRISELAKQIHTARKEKDRALQKELMAQQKELIAKRKQVRAESKKEIENTAMFNRAAEVYTTAEKLLRQQEDFSHFDEIAEKYDEAKVRVEEDDRIREEEEALRKKEHEEETARRKAERKNKKNKNKN